MRAIGIKLLKPCSLCSYLVCYWCNHTTNLIYSFYTGTWKILSSVCFLFCWENENRMVGIVVFSGRIFADCKVLILCLSEHMLAFYQLPTFFLVMSKRSIFWRLCTLGFFVFFPMREICCQQWILLSFGCLLLCFLFSLHPIYNVVLFQRLWNFRSLLREGIICLYPQVNSTWYW